MFSRFLFGLKLCWKKSFYWNDMKFTCLSKGRDFHFPPCHLIDLCGFRILLDCPMDLSALSIFSPIPTGLDCMLDEEASAFPSHGSVTPLSTSSLMHAEPWYKTVNNLHIWNPSFFDIVLISSPLGLLGLPFLTRMKGFSAKIYLTEATARLGQMMMEDLILLHMEFRQYYGSDDGFPLWMNQENLGCLPSTLRDIALGKDGTELGCWMPLYSAADIEDCMQKVETLRYAQEVCYNGTLLIKAFSSGSGIGACNWKISGPKRDIAIISSSIFASPHAMNFDYHALQGNDTILYSDFSFQDFLEDGGKSFSTNANSSYSRNDESNLEELTNSLCKTDEGIEELEKIAFVCSRAVESVQAGGSVLIPTNRIGVTLQLVEQVSAFLESSCSKVPIYMISSMAEELMAYISIIPEWLCEQRQEKMFSGESMFVPVKLLKEKRLHIFPAIHSAKLLSDWQEPCIIFCPHWSLRLGPAVHLLRRWSGDPNSLIVLEKGVDAELALLPFMPMKMKVLQCAFLSGITLQKFRPLLKVLQPKTVLLPEELMLQIDSNSCSFSVFPYSENKTVQVPNLKGSSKLEIAADLAAKCSWRKLKQQDINVTRLDGELLMNGGKLQLLSGKELTTSSGKPLLHWGRPSPEKLVNALVDLGIKGSIEDTAADMSDEASVVRLQDPEKGFIEIQETRSVVAAGDKNSSHVIYDALDSILDGI